MEERRVENNDIETNEKKEKGFLKTVKNIGGKAWDGVKSTTNKVKSGIEDHLEARQERKEYLEAYNAQTYSFEIMGVKDNRGNNRLIKAFRNIDDNFLEIASEEQNKDYIKSNTVLKELNDESEIKILLVQSREVDIKTIIDSQGQSHDIQIFKATYELKKEPNIQSVTNISNVNQNVTVGDHHKGDVVLTSNIEIELNNFFEEINKVSTRRFSRERKAQEEAIKIIGPVKDSIINGKEDKGLIDKFISLLGIFAPTLVSAFKNFL